MKIPISWLKDFVDLTGLEVTDIAYKLTMAGMEVEEIHYRRSAAARSMKGMGSKSAVWPGIPTRSWWRRSTRSIRTPTQTG